MAQFRSTADIMDLALSNAGEVTNGNSPYETQLLNYLNRVHHTLVSGGTIPIGKDTTVQIDEMWPWSKAKHPLLLDIQPKYTTGTVTLTNESEAGTFSSAPALSYKGWHITIDGRDEWFKIVSHTAGATAFQLDDHYTGDTGSGLSFKLVKLDYELVPDHISITSENNKLQFQETAGTTLTATLTTGTYTPSQLATQVQTQLNSTGGTPAYTVSYDSVSRKFTIASDRAGGAVFILVGTGSYSSVSAHKILGFDDENTTNAASIESTYPFSCIARISEPFKVYKNLKENIYGVDSETFKRDYPFSSIIEGIPNKFTVIREDADGTITVRFNAYPVANTRVEIDCVPIPRDLKDNSSSIPLVPRKHVDVLEDAATFYLLLNKNDDRAQMYANLLQGKLMAMVSQHRGSLVRSGEYFGQIIPRAEQVRRRNLFGVEPY